MSQRQRNSGRRAMLALVGSLLGGTLRAQAPATAEQPWSIPDAAIARAGELGDERSDWMPKPYDLPMLIDLAQRTNPQTRAAWEEARAAAAAIGLVESSYLPQLSMEALGGFERTPLPIPKT